MTIIPPVAGVNAGHSTGGGLLDTFKQAISGATGSASTTTQAPTQTSSGDGSVGLFDGVLKKALVGGALGAGLGFIPFIPGGPILGGIVGALGGAAMGVFSNWQKQKQIKAENEATLAAMGVQVNDPQIQQVLQSGNVSQLIPMMQASRGVSQSSGTAPTQTSTGSGSGDVTQDEIAAMQREAIANGVTPGPVVGMTAGGGGSAGDAGRPAAPTGTSSSDVRAIAPAQPGVGTSDAAAGASTVATKQSAEQARIVALIEQLQKQIDMLKDMLAQDERRRAESLQAQRSQASRAA